VTVTGSTVPGLPNTGVPPAGLLWPSAAGLLVLLIAAAFAKRRRAEPRTSDH
jgi:LPXTG-motif cell wall-anchored protein